MNEKFPVSIWTAVLRRGFVGCIRELILNDEPVDVVRFTEEQDIGKKSKKVSTSLNKSRQPRINNKSSC